MALRLGDIVLDRYVLHDKLGEGGFGEVWQAVDRVERRPVAIKALHANASDADRRRFEAEARILARLDHPHILKLYDSTITDDGSLLLVTELLGHQTLGDWVKSGMPRLEDVIVVARQICSALTAAHREGVLHRDLKPANVLVDILPSGSPQVTVLDFGIAKILGRKQPDITKTGEILGTPGYMSPEQLRGADVGPATDLYCLGLLLFIMLEGRTPFAKDSAMELCMAHLIEVAPAVSRGPVELRGLVAELLAKDPAKRPGSAAAVDGVLARIAGGAPELSATPTAQAASPAARLAVAVLVVLLASSIVVALWPEEAIPPPTPARQLPGALLKGDDAPSKPLPPRERAEEPARTGDHSPGCAQTAAPTGRNTTLLDRVSFQTGELLHYVPTTYDGRTPLPLVLLFHRHHSTAEQALEETGFEALAEQHGFVLAVPQSRRPPNVPWIKRDHPWLDTWLELLEGALCLDTSRYYLVGMSEGAAANEYFLCHHPARFAAVVGSGVRLSAAGSCRKRREDERTPRLEFVNEHDNAVPLEGGPLKPPCEGQANFWSLEEYEAFVREHLSCEGQPTPVQTPYDRVSCRTWACAAPYQVCDVEAGRFWSSQPWQDNLACHGPPHEVPRAQIAWDFLSRFRLEN